MRFRRGGDRGSPAGSSFASAALIGASLGASGYRCVRMYSRGKSADEVTNRGPMLFVLYLAKTNHDIEQQSLAGEQWAFVRLKAFKEVLNRRARSQRELIELTSRNAVDATLILINLLKRHPEQVSELALGEAKHLSVFADPRTDLSITG